VNSTPSRTQVVLARLVLGLSTAFVLLGLVMHGLSLEVVTRIWQNLIERPAGPIDFRFILQPAMAALAALGGGLQDARSGRAPFLQAMLHEPAQRSARLDEALVATSRILLLGLAMDLAYQWIEFDSFHPAEAVIVAFLLAFMPYVVLRGLIARIARRWVGKVDTGGWR
jgi:hypothetical protein